MPDGIIDVRAIGVVIATRRQAMGMTQYELSRDSGVSPSQLKKIEAGGVTSIGVEPFVHLARALDLTPDDLLRYAGVDTGREALDQLGGLIDHLTAGEREALLRMAQILIDLRH